MRLVLAGGGGATDSRPLDERFAEWLGPNGRLLYLPIALPEGHPLLPGCEAWIRSVFVPLGVATIETWHASEMSEPTARPFAERLRHFDGIYIGGGSTFRLLHLLTLAGLDRALIAYAEAGGPISGGSAGAIILGHDIGIARLVGDADEIGLADTAGLGLLPHYDVLPHYEPALDPLIDAHVQRTKRGVVAMSERAGVVVDGADRLDGGYESTRIFPAPNAEAV